MTEEKEEHAAVRFPPPAVGVLTIICGYLLGRFVPVLQGFGFPAPERYWIGGGLAVVAGIVFGAWPALHFRSTGQNPTPWSETPELVRHGPYRFTRNPMYVMMILVCIGFAIILNTAWILILTPVCATIIYFVAIRHEGTYLERKFGAAYREYRESVRRWI